MYDGLSLTGNSDNLLVRVKVENLSPNLMDYRGNSGFFYEFDCDKYQSLAVMITLAVPLLTLLTYFLASLIGLIPNCASSVIVTELYLNSMISLGTLLSGTLTGAGVGLLILFKENKHIKENLIIVSIIYIIGVIIGFLIDTLGIVF